MIPVLASVYVSVIAAHVFLSIVESALCMRLVNLVKWVCSVNRVHARINSA